MGHRLPDPAKGPHLGHDVGQPIVEPTGPGGLIVGLKPATLGQHHRRLLLQLDRRLVRPLALFPLVETPGHQVPGLPHGGQITGFQPGRIDRVPGRIVAREVIHGNRHRLRHETGIHPVAGDLERGTACVQHLHVVTDVFPEAFAVEFQPLGPARIAALLGRVHDPGGFRERFPRHLAVIGLNRPALPIYPGPVQVVGVGHLLELGDEEFVHVWSKGAGIVGVRLPFGRDAGPLGMVLAGDEIPYPGVMDIEPNPMLSRHLPPQRQRVLDDARRRPTHLCGVAGITGVAFAVVLHIVGFHLFQQPGDHLFREVRSQFRVRCLRMQIKVQPEKRFRPRQAAGFS